MRNNRFQIPAHWVLIYLMDSAYLFIEKAESVCFCFLYYSRLDHNWKRYYVKFPVFSHCCLSHSVTNQSNYVVLFVLRVKKGNWKPYQQDRKGLELIQRLQDPATARPEYWGECPTSTHPESVQLKEKNKSVRKSWEYNRVKRKWLLTCEKRTIEYQYKKQIKPVIY